MRRRGGRTRNVLRPTAGNRVEEESERTDVSRWTMSNEIKRESVVVSAVATNTVVTNNVEKSDESLNTDEVCRSHLQKYDVG